MSSIISFLFGVAVGVSGTLLHNSYHPIGLLVSLIAIWYGSVLVSRMYQSRASNLFFALGWLLVIVRGSSIGNGGELLIESNGYGNLLVIVGMALLLISIFRAKRLN